MESGRRLVRWVTVAVIAACTAGAVLAFAGVATPARAPLALAFLAVIPGLAVASLFRGVDPFARIVIAGAAAIVIDILIAETMIASGTWSTRTGVAAVALVSVAIAASGPLVAGRAGPSAARYSQRGPRVPRGSRR